MDQLRGMLKGALAKQEAEMEERMKMPRLDRLAVTHPEGFNVESLGHWITACAKANIEFVPATCLTELDIELILEFDSHPPKLIEAFKLINEAKAPNHMLRWDVCAPYDVKYGMSKGTHEWNDSYLNLSPDDPRAFDLIYGFPALTMPIWLRPWVKAQIVDSYPVEYRVFVLDSEVIGVSNYYPQRPLADTYETQSDVQAAIQRTNQIVSKIELPWNSPKMKRLGFHTDTVSCTLDFLKTADGEILFLEGGPPHHQVWGAHPCCFQPGKIKGIALEDRNEKGSN